MTESANEMPFEEYFGDVQQLTIPVFQRSYDWTMHQLKHWFQDLESYSDLYMQDRTDEKHFCGTILSTKEKQTGKISQVHIVDGQQRYITTYLVLLAIVRKFLIELKEDPQKDGEKEPRVDWVREQLHQLPMEKLSEIADDIRVTTSLQVDYFSLDELDRERAMLSILTASSQYREAKDRLIDIKKINNYLKKYIFFDHLESSKGHIDGNSNLKICVSKDDREEMNDIIENLMKLDNWQAHEDTLPTFIPFSTSGTHKKSKINNAWKHVTQFIDRQWDMGDMKERLDALEKVSLQVFRVIEIELKDQTQVTKIFDRLNATGKPLTIGQLVKNDIFGRQGGDIKAMEALNDGPWKKFENRFKSLKDEDLTDLGINRVEQLKTRLSNPDIIFEEYLFPFGLITVDPETTKSEMYGELSKSWSGTRTQSGHDKKKTPQAIIKELQEFQDDYMDVAFALNRREAGDDFSEAIERLIRLDYPSTIYPFTMRLSNSLFRGKIDEDEASKTLKLIESFLVRRAVCEKGTGGLHALFKTLWRDQETEKENGGKGKLNERIAQLLKDKTGTHPWPDNVEFEASLLAGDLYNQRKVCRFILEEYEDKQSQNNKNECLIRKYEVEHIYPQSPIGVDYWDTHFHSAVSKKRDKKQREQEESEIIERNIDKKHRLGNLTVLSPRDNKESKNDPWPDKRTVFRDENYFKSTQEIEKWMKKKSYKDWTPDAIDGRTEDMTKWALGRWHHSPK